MKSLNVLDIIRKVLSVLSVLCLFLPWIVVKGSAKALGVSASASDSVMGLNLVASAIVPVVLVVAIFLGSRNEKWNAIYLYAPIVGVVLTILLGIFCRPGGFKSSSKVVSASVDYVWGIGLWLTLLDFIAIFVITLILRLKISKESLKEDGIKGVAEKSVNELKNSIPNMPSTGAIMDKIPIDSIKEMKDKATPKPKKVANSVSDSSPAKQTYLDMKDKLDEALKSDIITEEEYKKKLQSAKVRFVREDTIERIELQYELDIISAEEREAKLAKLVK